MMGWTPRLYAVLLLNGFIQDHTETQHLTALYATTTVLIILLLFPPLTLGTDSLRPPHILFKLWFHFPGNFSSCRHREITMHRGDRQHDARGWLMCVAGWPTLTGDVRAGPTSIQLCLGKHLCDQWPCSLCHISSLSLDSCDFDALERSEAALLNGNFICCCVRR